VKPLGGPDELVLRAGTVRGKARAVFAEVLGNTRSTIFVLLRTAPYGLTRGRVQAPEGYMTVGRFFGKTGRGLAVAAAILAAIGLTTVPRPADAGGWGGGGIGPGAAVALGLGSFALGSVLANPYYRPYYYPYAYYYPPAPAYYPPPAPYYPPARSCWNPYYQYYYAC
jgi:hypothetical protein